MTDTEDAWAAHVMRVAATLRPEGFQPWNHHRPGGWTLFEARYALVPSGYRSVVSHHLARLDARIEGAEAIEMIHGQCWQLVLHRLRQNEVWMEGCQFGKTEVQGIPTLLLDNPKPDFAANEITCNGVTFGLVRLRLNKVESGVVTYTTGRPGRPTSEHLFKAEFQVRVVRGEAERTVAAEGRYLLNWLQCTHPGAAAVKAKSIEDAIRQEHRAYRATLSKSGK